MSVKIFKRVPVFRLENILKYYVTLCLLGYAWYAWINIIILLLHLLEFSELASG